MLVFGNDTKMRGCFNVFFTEFSIAKGAHIKLPTDLLNVFAFKYIAKDYADPLVVVSIEYSQKERYSLIPCFNDVIYTYAFGHDAQMMSVGLVGFLTQKDGTKTSKVIKDLNKRYAVNRISQDPRGAEIIIGDNILEGFIVGMRSATHDAQHNLQAFSIDLLSVKVQDK